MGEMKSSCKIMSGCDAYAINLLSKMLKYQRLVYYIKCEIPGTPGFFKLMFANLL